LSADGELAPAAAGEGDFALEGELEEALGGGLGGEEEEKRGRGGKRERRREKGGEDWGLGASAPR